MAGRLNCIRTIHSPRENWWALLGFKLCKKTFFCLLNINLKQYIVKNYSIRGVYIKMVLVQFLINKPVSACIKYEYDMYVCV